MRMDPEAEGDWESRYGRRLRRGLYVLLGFLLFNVGAGVVLAQFQWTMLKAYQIPSSAMEPTLHCARPGSGCLADSNDRILVLRFHPFWTPSRGDIVVFKTPLDALTKCGAGGSFVKRLIALPGDSWEQRAGTVYVNGRQLSEPYVGAERRDKQSYPRRTIPEDQYFFMGDNRTQSCDSREFGSVPRRNLVGPVAAVYLPLDRVGVP